MNAALSAMQAADWWHLFGYFLSVSLLTVGGAIATSPDMYRVLVGQQAWLTPLQFNNSVAIAQAAPGPNVLFIALIGLQIGLNASQGLLRQRVMVAGPNNALIHLSSPICFAQRYTNDEKTSTVLSVRRPRARGHELLLDLRVILVPISGEDGLPACPR